MKQLRIATRLPAAFAFLIVMLGMVAVVAFYGLGSVKHDFEDYAGVSENALRVSHIDRDIVDMRRNALLYKESGNQDALKQVRERIASIKNSVAKAVSVTASQERRAGLQRIASLEDEYAAGFNRLVEIRSTYERSRGELDAIGAETRRNLTEFGDKLAKTSRYQEAAAVADVQEAMLLSRINMLRFLADTKEDDAKNALDSLARAKTVAEQSMARTSEADVRRAIGQASDGIARYETAGKTLISIASESGQLFNGKMANVAIEMAKAAAAVEASQIGVMKHDLELGRRDAAIANMTVIGLSVAAVGLGILMAFFLVRGIVRPVKGLTTSMDKLAQGDLDADVPGTARRDELGEMAKAVLVFKDTMIAKKKADEAAALEADAKMRRAQVLDDLTKRFEANVSALTQGLASAATEMEATATVMTETAQLTTNQSVSVASAAEQTSANVQTVAVATEELSSSIREIAEQVAKSSTIAGRAAQEATRTNGTVQTLAAAAQKIGDVVALINNIAGQTNLLALNATIEAARAGEAGRGFAVVASEVKELASQTAKATEEIASQINGIQEETRNAVTAIQTIGSTIDEMNAIASGVAAAMEEQGAATGEIARNVQQAAQGTQVVTGNILDVKRGAGETGSAAAQVLSAAQELARHSEDLGREVDSFLSGVKAA